MKTKNPFRKDKMEEIDQIWKQYPDLTPSERLFVVLDELVRKATHAADHTKLASLNEYAKVFNGIFVNAKTGRPTDESLNWIRKLVTLIRKDKGHPHIRPYTEPHIEVLVDGTEVVRYYLNLLRGTRAVTYVNNRLEMQRQGLKESQAANRDLANVKKVMKEADLYRGELEVKQQEANDKKRRRKKDG
jgi:hypothetical protein